MRRICLLLSIAVACAYGWQHATRERATPPHQLAWFDADDRPTRPNYCGDAPFLVEGRMIARCKDGFASLDPEAGRAKLVWPTTDTGQFPIGFAYGDDGRWGVVLKSETGITAGIADRDGWIVEPTRIVHGWGRVWAVRLHDDVLEVVLQFKDAPIELHRITRETCERDELPSCEGCVVRAVLPKADGFTLVAKQLDRVVSVDAYGTVTPAPAELGWMLDVRHLDRTAHGALGYGHSIVEPDGRRGGMQPIAPEGDFMFWQHVERVDGVARSRNTWEHGHTQRVVIGERNVEITREHDIWQIDGRDTVTAARNAPFQIIARRAGGYWMIDAKGRYVTLDAELRRIDHRGPNRGLLFALCGLIAIALAWIASVPARAVREKLSRASL